MHPSLSTRDRDGILKTYSGLMKVVHPTGEATREEQAEILECALELRKRVKDQLYRIDETFDHVQFAYRQKDGAWVEVHTLEEDSWPDVYHALDLVPAEGQGQGTPEPGREPGPKPPASSQPSAPAAEQPNEEGERRLFEGTRHYRENQRGVSYELLFGDYIDGARSIVIVDPYIRAFYQCRNLMDLLVVCLERMDYSVDSPKVHLITGMDVKVPMKQVEFLQRIEDAMEPQDLDFTFEFREHIHARHIYVDDRWDIKPDRGLDIWQKFDSDYAFSLEARMPEKRQVRLFEVTYLRAEPGEGIDHEA